VLYALIIGESAGIAAVGAALGIIIATPLTQAFGTAVAMFFPVFEVSPLLVAVTAIAAVVAFVNDVDFSCFSIAKHIEVVTHHF